jgi:signal recognition particle subunit SRP54
MLAACDLQRPAAIQQLQVLGEQIDVPVFTATGTTPPEVARQALERCKHLFLDVLIVDTAGRLSIDEDLMNELAAIEKAVGSHERLLVLDAATGQEAVNVAEAFGRRVDLTGVIFTKLDGDARGGAILSVREASGIPVRFIGVGEQVEALDMFHPTRMAERILGMGDVLALIEKAEAAFSPEDSQDLQGKITTGKMDFADFLQQIRMVRRLGPLKNVIKMLPGAATMLPEEALDGFDERKMDHIEAIILSMTPEERSNPDILNGSRRRRIANGSGRTPQEVNRLVDQLFEMRRQMKQFSKMEKRMRRVKRR